MREMCYSATATKSIIIINKAAVVSVTRIRFGIIPPSETNVMLREFRIWSNSLINRRSVISCHEIVYFYYSHPFWSSFLTSK